jgi:hypothetical protein
MRLMLGPTSGQNPRLTVSSLTELHPVEAGVDQEIRMYH